MDPMQIPVPTTPVAPQMQPEVPQIPVQTIPQVAPVAPQMQQAPAAAPQEDFVDKLLKGIVSFIGNLINKNNQAGPSVPLGAVPQAPVQYQQAAQTPIPQVQAVPVVPQQIPVQVPVQTVPQVQTSPANIFNTIGSGIGNVANQAVNVAQTGVNSVVQNAQDYITEPAPTTPAVDVQNFLSQNYQAAQVAAPVAAPIEIPAPAAQTPIPQVPTPTV